MSRKKIDAAKAARKRMQDVIQVVPNTARRGALQIVQGKRVLADVRVIPIGRGKRAREDWSIHCMWERCTYATHSSPLLAHALYIGHFGESHETQTG